jgi:hypothetical protein
MKELEKQKPQELKTKRIREIIVYFRVLFIMTLLLNN